MINISMNKNFFIAHTKGLMQKQQPAEFVPSVASKAHRCKSSPSPINISKQVFYVIF